MSFGSELEIVRSFATIHMWSCHLTWSTTRFEEEYLKGR